MYTFGANQIALKRFIVSLLLSSISLVILAQEDSTSTDEIKVQKLESFLSYKASEFHLDSPPFKTIDTTFDKAYYYNPQLHNFKTNLGNNGTAQKSLYLDYNYNSGFKLNFDQLNDFRFLSSTNRYFEVSQPYAKAAYINGAQKEEGINIAFTQNIRENWNIGLQYKKIGSIGFYQRQRTAINSFKLFQSFKSKNNRYGIIANVNYNDSYNEENGGIKSDSIFLFDPNTNRQGIEVNSPNAKNNSRSQEFFLKQHLNFGKQVAIIPKDSTDTTETFRIIPLFSPYHAFRYHNQEFIFEDASPAPENYPLGSVSPGVLIQDETKLTQFDNQIGVRISPLSNTNGIFKTLEVDAWGKLELLQYQQRSPWYGNIYNKDNLDNLIIGTSIKNDFNKNNSITLDWSNTIEGFDAGDSKLGFKSFHKIKWLNVSPSIEASTLNPAMVFRKYSSTPYSWNFSNLSLINEQKEQLNIEVNKTNTRLNFTGRQITNYTYFDANSTVKQHSNQINYFKAKLSQHIKLSIIHLDLSVMYQTSDQAGIINVPELAAYSKFYIQSTLFKKDLSYRIGADLYATSDYYGDGYNAAIRQYYSQNSEKITTYPWLEVYLMAKIQRTYFFAKLTNVLEGNASPAFFAAPNYPLPDRAFKFGIKWEFLN